MPALTSAGSPHPAARCAALPIAEGSTRLRHALTGKAQPWRPQRLTGHPYLLTQQAQVSRARPPRPGCQLRAEAQHPVVCHTHATRELRPQAASQHCSAPAQPPAQPLPPPLWGQPSKNHHFSHIVWGYFGVAYYCWGKRKILITVMRVVIMGLA